MAAQAVMGGAAAVIKVAMTIGSGRLARCRTSQTTKGDASRTQTAVTATTFQRLTEISSWSKGIRTSETVSGMIKAGTISGCIHSARKGMVKPITTPAGRAVEAKRPMKDNTDRAVSFNQIRPD